MSQLLFPGVHFYNIHRINIYMANDKTIKAMIISSITIYTGRMLERNHLREQHPRRRLYTFVGGKGGGVELLKNIDSPHWAMRIKLCLITGRCSNPQRSPHNFNTSQSAKHDINPTRANSFWYLLPKFIKMQSMPKQSNSTKIKQLTILQLYNIAKSKPSTVFKSPSP